MSKKLTKEIYKKAYYLMCTARAMSDLFEENKEVTSKYVHATSKGHEAIQLAVGLQLTENDWVAPYYRDDSILLGIGMQPYELMLQLLCKKDDPFSGGRTYYSHPSLKREGFPKIPHQSSATGMQGIPTTGVAMGIQYQENEGLTKPKKGEEPVTVCSFGDASITEGEVAEAFQMAALKKLPILYLVQDNEWDISAHSSEMRAVDATHYAKGFGLKTYTIDGTDFTKSYQKIQDAFIEIRDKRTPILIHAKVPLLNHHTSGVRMEWYRDDLEEARSRDPFPKLKAELLANGFSESDLVEIEKQAKITVENDYQKALKAEDPNPEDLFSHDFAPTPITEEKGDRAPKDKEATVMVDSALFAIKEIMAEHPESLLYGQDVGKRLGGVFREAATLAQTFGDNRVFNTPIQEAFIIGSTAALITGLIFVQFPRVEKLAEPYFNALNVMPRLALAPLFILWFGLGLTSKVAVGLSLSFFIVLSSTVAGMRGVSQDHLTLCKTLGAKPTTIFFKVTLPGAIPIIFSGLRLGLIYSLLGVVGTEIVAAEHGIGQTITSLATSFNANGVMALVFVLAFLGVVIVRLMTSIEIYLSRWK